MDLQPNNSYKAAGVVRSGRTLNSTKLNTFSCFLQVSKGSDKINNQEREYTIYKSMGGLRS